MTPELPANRRAAGPQRPGRDTGGRPALPMPDQSRYGAATSDPLGRQGPGWAKGKTGLPTLRNGWRYDPATRRTTKLEEPDA